jgi:hypothetical protein
LAAPLDELRKHVSIHSGRLSDVSENLYAIVRDELFFMPAFFDHYRKLGIKQFVILDDGSVDGTLQFLCDQPDCVVLRSEWGFGKRMDVVDPGGSVWRGTRWGTVLKNIIPRTFLQDKYALYVDADEFLILPEKVPDAGAAFAILAEHNVDCVAANLIEFYPKSVSDIEGQFHPRTFADLTERYCWFDGRPLTSINDGEFPLKLETSASHRLFRQYGVQPSDPLAWLGLRIFETADQRRKRKWARSSTYKTPIIRWREGVWLKSSHLTNVPPTSMAILGLAHFKFSHDAYNKIDRAVRWRSHHSKGFRYQYYGQLLQNMKKRNGMFLSDHSTAYQGSAQLEKLGLLKWNLRSVNMGPAD